MLKYRYNHRLCLYLVFLLLFVFYFLTDISLILMCREDEGPVVELDLACGVFDLKDETALAAAERSLINQGVTVEKFSGGSTSSSSGSSSSDESDNGGGDDISLDEDAPGPSSAVAKKEKKKNKKSPQHHHPGIEEIS